MIKQLYILIMLAGLLSLSVPVSSLADEVDDDDV
jgi:hypothetical protein